jgi:tetratricopeptide (TPR) repeat protein
MKKGPAINGGQILRAVALLVIAAGWLSVLWKFDALAAIVQALLVVVGAFSLQKLDGVPLLSRAQKVGLQAAFWVAFFALPAAYVLWRAIGFFGPVALAMGVLAAAGLWWKVNVHDQKACHSLSRKAAACVERGEYAEAEKILKKALNHAMQLKANRDEVLAIGFRDLAILYTKLNRWPEAQEFCLRAITVMESQESPAWKHLPSGLEVLARIYARQRNFASFEAILDKAYQLAVAQLGQNAPEVAAKLMEYAKLCEAENRPLIALRFYQQSAAAIQDAIGDAAEPAALCRHCAGQAAVRAGQWQMAVTEFREAASIYARIFGPGDPKVGPSVEALGEALLVTGDVEAGLAQLVRAVEIREDEHGATHPVVGRLLLRTAECHLAMGQNQEAGRDAQRAVSILERVNDSQQHIALGLAARVKIQTGDILGAEKLLSRAAAHAREAGHRAQLAVYLESRAELMGRLGHQAEADALHTEIQKLREHSAVAA